MPIFKNFRLLIAMVAYALLLYVVHVMKNINTSLNEVNLEIVSEDEFISIFDGKTLNNWEGDSRYWSVLNGNLTGIITPETLLKNNTFIIWQGGEPSDFELKLDFRISKNGNSGINYRSQSLETTPFALRGYQADIDGKDKYTGQNYEERKRTTLAYRGEKVIILPQPLSSQKTDLKNNIEKNCWQSRTVASKFSIKDTIQPALETNGWNTAHIIVKGNRMQHFINGQLISDTIDNDTINRTFSGKIGVQVHVGPPMKVEYRNILLKTL